MRTFAQIGIGPVGSLGETAEILGRVLGGLLFLEDEQRRYDEYPAYIAEEKGVRYALLGVPAPGCDLRDEPTNDFALMVEPISPHGGGEIVDVSEDLIGRIQGDGRLQCWSLD